MTIKIINYSARTASQISKNGQVVSKGKSKKRIIFEGPDGDDKYFVHAFREKDLGRFHRWVLGLFNKYISITAEHQGIQEKWLVNRRSLEHRSDKTHTIWEAVFPLTAEQFNQLSPDAKRELYIGANRQGNEALVRKLHIFGMKSEELEFQKPGLDILAPQMDCITAKEALRNFLITLRQEGCLMTQKEFQVDSEDKKFIYKGNPFFQKNEFGRLQGRRYLQETIEKLQLTRVKVPKKIGVLRKNSTDQIRVGVSGDTPQEIFVSVEIYAEKIERSKRKLSREEMEELLTLFEQTGYHDIKSDNMIIAEDGIYIIDTEANTFSSSPRTPFPTLTDPYCYFSLMDKQDHEWLANTLKRHYQVEQQNLDTQKFEEAYIRSGLKDRCRTPFTFSTEEILGMSK